MVACDAQHTACGVFWLMAYGDEALFKFATSTFFQTHLLHCHSCALLQLRHLLIQFLQQRLTDSAVLSANAQLVLACTLEYIQSTRSHASESCRIYPVGVSIRMLDVRRRYMYAINCCKVNMFFHYQDITCGRGLDVSMGQLLSASPGSQRPSSP